MPKAEYQMTKSSPGTYIRHSRDQIEYLNKHLGNQYDKDVATNAGLSLNQVRYYRTSVLKISNRSVKSRKPKHIAVSINSIREELTALINFYATYNGCMKETLELRIRDLKTKI